MVQKVGEEEDTGETIRTDIGKPEKFETGISPNATVYRRYTLHIRRGRQNSVRVLGRTISGAEGSTGAARPPPLDPK